MASLGWLQEKLPGCLKAIPTHMDFEGQRAAERIFQIIITISAVIGFGLGYVEQRFSYTVFTVLAGFALSCLVILPPWSFFRRHPLQWQKSGTGPESYTTATVAATAGSSAGPSTSGKSDHTQKHKKKSK